jgi:hypothetical protein
MSRLKRLWRPHRLTWLGNDGCGNGVVADSSNDRFNASPQNNVGHLANEL